MDEKELDIIVIKRRLSQFISIDVLDEMDEETLRGTYAGFTMQFDEPKN